MCGCLDLKVQGHELWNIADAGLCGCCAGLRDAVRGASRAEQAPGWYVVASSARHRGPHRMPATISRAALERLLAVTVALAVLLTITVVSSTADQQHAAVAWLDGARRAAWAPARLGAGASRRLLQEASFSSRWVEQLHVHGESSDGGAGARHQVPVPLVLRLDDEAAKKADREAWVQARTRLRPGDNIN